ncbi:MAG: hypothetical protein JXR96_13140 [Deltaproteobacteria bacterium]|nr:hypothetical protein [Deltaproteobacteria bacterium]
MEENTRGVWKAMAIGPASLLVVAALVLLPIWCEYREELHGHGEQLDMLWAGWAFLSIERVEHEDSPDGYRLSLVDPLGGSLLTRRVLDVESGQPECRFAPPGRLWCRWNGEISLLSAQSLQTIADWQALRGLHASLKGGLSPFQPQVDPQSGDLVVGTNDGLRVRIDPNRLAADQAGQETRFPGLGQRSQVTASSRELDEVRYDFEGHSATDRQVLRRRGPRDRDWVELQFSAEAGPDSPASVSYLKAELICPQDTRTREPGRLQDPPGLLIAHQTSLDDEQARRLVTRVDLEGKPLWTCELPLAQIEAAFLGADRLVFSLRRRVEQSLAVDLASGRLLWTYPH